MLTHVPHKLDLLTLPSPSVCKACLQTSKSTPMEAKSWKAAFESGHINPQRRCPLPFVGQAGRRFDTINHATYFFLEPNDAQAMTG